MMSNLTQLKSRFKVDDVVPLGIGITYTECLACGWRGYHESCAGHEAGGGKLLYIGPVCCDCLGIQEDRSDDAAE